MSLGLMSPVAQDAFFIEGQHIFIAPSPGCSPLIIGARIFIIDVIDPDRIPVLSRHLIWFSKFLPNLLLGGAILRRFKVERFLRDEC